MAVSTVRHSLQRGCAGQKTLLAGDRRAFIQKRYCQIRSTSGDDIADGRAHQTGDARQAGDEYPFLPHLLKNILNELCIEFRAREFRFDRAGPSGSAPSRSPKVSV